MKRHIALLACLLALTACGNDSDSDQASADAPASNGSQTSEANSSEAGKSQPSDDEAGKSAANDGEAGGDGAQQAAADGSGSAFANDKEKQSYALGMDIGNSLKELPIKIDTEAMAQGLRDTVNGDETRLTQKELDEVMNGLVKNMEAAQEQKAAKQAQSNLEKGKKFLSENKDKKGVKTTDSGLQYKVIEKGDGPSPDKTDSVTVHYEGRLIDGTVFDSSRKRGEPVTFPVDAVIPGWTEALQLMKQGAKYELYIPADLAYGERGAGAQIGPNETLIFDVELIEADSSSRDDGASGSRDGGAGAAAESSDKTDQGSGKDDAGGSEDKAGNRATGSSDEMTRDNGGDSVGSTRNGDSNTEAEPSEPSATSNESL